MGRIQGVFFATVVAVVALMNDRAGAKPIEIVEAKEGGSEVTLSPLIKAESNTGRGDLVLLEPGGKENDRSTWSDIVRFGSAGFLLDTLKDLLPKDIQDDLNSRETANFFAVMFSDPIPASYTLINPHLFKEELADGTFPWEPKEGEPGFSGDVTYRIVSDVPSPPTILVLAASALTLLALERRSRRRASKP